MPLQGIIFDFYGVLSIRAHQAYLEKIVPNPEDMAKLRDVGRQRDLGLITPEDFYQEVSAVSGVDPQELSAQMHHERAINQQLVDFIRHQLKEKYKIGLLSNATGDLYTYVDKALLDELFDDVLISSTVGMVKPDPRIFHLECERLGVTPEATVMVDDLEDNCSGAKLAGLQAIQYVDFHQFRQDFDKL